MRASSDLRSTALEVFNTQKNGELVHDFIFVTMYT